ncbi:hypothetical protein M404DRAFT_998507 [Pisolithus tinctorius Marx 270]|uniref:VASt domain-containing protein n=1 Tax=Pisolithus tinctorius Marx 270 TaxID=870435 RepID=A0A0C3JDC0_PISTI|nr:hypothetical protein M404DRAFT_998507 [Pisolithus tinctorius Marx 270]
MAPNFLAKLVRPSAAQNSAVPSGNTPASDEPRLVSSSSRRSSIAGEPYSHLAPKPYGEETSDTHSRSSRGSFKIGVIPPSPHPAGSPMSGFTDLPSTESGHTHDVPFSTHRRTRSQDRQVPDRHAISLAAHTMNVNPEWAISEEVLSTPHPDRPEVRGPTTLEASPAQSLRQLSPASSTGNLRGLIDKHTSRSATGPDVPNVEKKPSKQSIRSRTQPPVPLKLDHINKSNARHDVRSRQNGHHEDGNNEAMLSGGASGVVESPTAASSQKAESREFLNLRTDVDATSLRSAASSTSKKTKQAGSGWRRPSVGNPTRKNTGIASALAASGLAMANATSQVPPLPTTPLPQTPRNGNAQNGSKSRERTMSVNNAASPSVYSMPGTINGGNSARQISLSKSDYSDRQYQSDSSESTGGSESDDELDLNEENIPVTGFAVASSKRNADFHELFPNIPEGDYLIEDYGCALQREILIQGRIYISENHICFHANIFGWITDLSIPIYEITGLEKKMTAFVIPNAIQITTRQAKYTFASFLSRDTTYDVIANIWRLARPEYSVTDGPGSRTNSSRDIVSAPSVSEAVAEKGTAPVAGANKVTHCSCSKSGDHLNEVALETVLPGTPEKINNLMFASGFIKHFMRVDQKLTDIQISDWTPVAPGSKLLSRNMSYIKPLNNSVGPRQTKCELHDESVYCDFDDHVVMMTTTRTPDVPSGGVFSVKTRTCIMWASAVSTRVIVTTQVEWTGRSFIKSLIEKSAIEGQKQYHSDLDKAMRMYIQEHQSEFIPEGIDPCAVAPVEPITPIAEAAELALDGVSGEEVWKARERDRNRRGLQWAYDTLDGAYNVAKRSTMGAIELVKEAWDQSSSTTILWFVIVALVFSNIWTLALVGKREEAGRRKEAKKAEEREKWVKEVVHSIWEEMSARPSGSFMPALQLGPSTDWKAEIVGLRQALDAVEERVKVIRENLDALD